MQQSKHGIGDAHNKRDAEAKGDAPARRDGESAQGITGRSRESTVPIKASQIEGARHGLSDREESASIVHMPVDWEMIAYELIEEYEEEIAFIEGRRLSGALKYSLGVLVGTAFSFFAVQSHLNFYTPFPTMQRVSGHESTLVWCLIILSFTLAHVFLAWSNHESLDMADGILATAYGSAVYAAPSLCHMLVFRTALGTVVAMSTLWAICSSLKKHNEPFREGVFQTLWDARVAVTSGLLAAYALIPLVLGGVLFEAEAQVKNEVSSSRDEAMLVESGIRDGGFTGLQDWLDFAQHVVNVEARELGFSDDDVPKVRATVMEERACAGYVPFTNTILINLLSLSPESMEGAYSYSYLARIVLHEMAHAEQHRILSGKESIQGNEIDPELDEGTLATWRRESSLYPILSYGTGYFSLDIEQSAEEYARRRMDEYLPTEQNA